MREELVGRLSFNQHGAVVALKGLRFLPGRQAIGDLLRTDKDLRLAGEVAQRASVRGVDIVEVLAVAVQHGR